MRAPDPCGRAHSPRVSSARRCVMKLARTRNALFPVILLIAGLAAGAWVTAQTGRLPFSYQTVRAAAAVGPVNDRMSFEVGFAPVVEKLMPSVVNVASS